MAAATSAAVGERRSRAVVPAGSGPTAARGAREEPDTPTAACKTHRRRRKPRGSPRGAPGIFLVHAPSHKPPPLCKRTGTGEMREMVRRGGRQLA